MKRHLHAAHGAMGQTGLCRDRCRTARVRGPWPFVVTWAALGLALAAPPLSYAGASAQEPAKSPAPAPVPESREPASPPERPAPNSESPDAPHPAAEALKQEAFDVTRRLAATFPDDPATLVVTGNVHLMAGDSVEARRCWEEALRRNPRFACAYNCLALVATAEGDCAKAATLWRQALEIAPNMPDVRERLARVLIDLGKPQDAVAVLDQGPQKSTRKAESHFLLGQAYLELKDYEKARPCYEAAIQADPKHTRSYYGLATVVARVGQPEKAEACRKKFHELKTADLEAVRAIKDDASTDLAVMRRRMAEALVGAAAVYDAHGHLPKAEPLWRRAAALDPRNTESRLQLALVYQRTGKGPDSLHLYRQLLEIEPGNPLYHTYAGALCVQLGQLAAAEAAFENVVRLAPQRSWGYQGLAQIYLGTNRRLSEAKAHAETAVRLDPVAPNYDILGEVCRATGDRAGALAAFRRAAELEPENPKYRQKCEALTQGG